MRLPKEHAEAHAAIEGDEGTWEGDLDRDRLLVHIARFHGWAEANVDGDYGLFPLLIMHDRHHGVKQGTATLPKAVERLHQRRIARGGTPPANDPQWSWAIPPADKD